MIEFDQLARIRSLYVQLVDSTSEEELFRVPDGFRNHIAWNAAHAIAAQQLLHYRLSGLEPYLPDDLLARYSRGTGPDDGDSDTFRQVMEFAHSGPELLRDDYEAGRFTRFKPYETAAAITLSTIEEAIAFNNFHEGVHLGYILAQRKALGIS